MKSTEIAGIDEAIAAVGSQTALATQLGCSQQNVHQWKSRGWVPASRLAEVEQVTGIPRTRLANPKLRHLFESAI